MTDTEPVIIEASPELLPAPSAQKVEGTLARLDEQTRTGHTTTQLMASFLADVCETPASREAYQRGLLRYLQWCTEHGLDVLAVRQPEAGMYAHWLKITPVPRTGRPYSRKSRDQMIAIAASFYRYLYRTGAIDHNPFLEVKRPNAKTPERPTEYLDKHQALAVLAASKTVTHRGLGSHLPPLIVHLMIDLGIRVSEVCKANLESLGHHHGIRTLTVHAKGGKTLVRPVPVQLAPLLEAYLAHRPEPEGDDAQRALFLDARGRRITRWQVRQLLARCAKEAGVPNWDRITPHSTRHTWNYIAETSGVDLESRQRALGHSSPTTTQGYSHAALQVESDPAHLVAAALYTQGR